MWKPLKTHRVSMCHLTPTPDLHVCSSRCAPDSAKRHVPFRERSETHVQRQPRPLQGAQRNTRAATAASPSGSAAKHTRSDSRVPFGEEHTRSDSRVPFRERTGCHRGSWGAPPAGRRRVSEDRFPEGLVPLGPEVLPVEPLKTEFRKACADPEVLPPPGRRRVSEDRFPEGLVPLGPEVLPVEPLKTEFRKAWCHWVQRCSPPGWNRVLKTEFRKA
jgi:hypothetical protein